MRITPLLLILAFAFSSYSYADARLDRVLGLDMNQARQVQQIEKQYRKAFRSKRQVLNRELRKLRRARIANDSRTMAQQERIAAQLEAALKQIRQSADHQIRQVLTADQRAQFEAVIQQRKASVGSSRDAKYF